jgi:uracil-DNA glycosylase family 4
MGSVNDPRPYPPGLSAFQGWQPSADGALTHGVMLCGESLGSEEVAASRPFVGPAGRLLDRLIARTTDPATGKQLARSEFLIDNCVRAQPPGNDLNGPWHDEALEYFAQFLKETIRTYKPKVIVPLGAHATRWFLPETMATLKEIKKVRGYIYETPWGLVLPTYHPAYLLRGQMALAQVFQHDLLRAVSVARMGLSRPPQKYVLSPSPQEAYAFLEAYREARCPPLDSDIETPYSERLDEADRIEEEREEDDLSYTILRVSFSFRPHEAITFPWQPPYTEIAKALYATPGVKRFYNGLAYDVPRLEANGCPLSGDIHDLMLFFRRLEPHLPYGLSYVATLFTDLPEWKSKSKAEPEFYSCVDSDALGQVASAIERELRKRGHWEKTVRNVVHLFKVLRKMSKRGVRVDAALRAASKADFEAHLDAVQAQAASLAPLAVRRLKVYKTTPKEVVRSVGEWVRVPTEVDVPEGKFYDEGSGRLKKIPEPKKERKKRAAKRSEVGTSGALEPDILKASALVLEAYPRSGATPSEDPSAHGR